jgi:hypothetical protein
MSNLSDEYHRFQFVIGAILIVAVLLTATLYVLP